MTTTYTILTEKMEEVEKKLKRLQKKAQKYDIPFSYSFGEPYCYESKRRDDYGAPYIVKYEIIDLTIESEIIKKGDYTIIARIEHDIAGNIVNVFVGEMETAWATIPAHCDHCNGNHGQKVTFIVENGSERRQVGRTCLKEYCGIDPQMVGAMNQFFEEMDEYSPERGEILEGVPHVYDAVEILAHAIEVFAEQGYRKSEEMGSNKGEILRRVSEGTKPKHETIEQAEKLAEEIASLTVEDAVEWNVNNVQTRIKGFYCKPTDFGYFAYAPVAMERRARRMETLKRRAEEKSAIAAKSGYVGIVGERMDFTVSEAQLLTSWENQYGITFLYRFIDSNGNVLMWFASKRIDTEGLKRIKATVKEHSERDGIKQTIITRVKVA